MRIAVMGAGGVGGYFGGRLAEAGHEVAFIARGKHLDAISANGLTLRTPAGETVVRAKASEDPASLGPVDVVVFAVKLWDTETAAEAIRPLVEQGATVIPFQNGVESIDRLARVLGPERVMGGAAYIAARIAQPGVIVQTGSLARLRFGPALPSQQRVAESFLAACRDAGIDAELTGDIVRVLWEKFVMLVAVSAATTVARRSIGVVRSDPDLRWLLESCMRETWTLGRARGIALAADFVEQSMRFAEQFAPETKSSMLGDLEAGGKLEVRWLSGAVARMSAEAGLDAPVNRAAFAALKPWQNGTIR